MTIDQFLAEINQACAGLPGSAEVNFKCIAEKSAGQVFATINSISKIGDVVVVYPNPESAQAAHVVVEFA